MRLIRKTKDMRDMKEPKPMGPAFDVLQAGQATWMEIWGSEFGDPGEDKVEFRLVDSDNKIIAIREVKGY